MQDNPSGITPLDTKVILYPPPAEEFAKTKGGIFIPDKVADKEKFAYVTAKLIAIGSNAFMDWGDAVKPKPGDMVLLAQYAGMRHKGADGQDYTIANDSEVMAIMEAAQ